MYPEDLRHMCFCTCVCVCVCFSVMQRMVKTLKMKKIMAGTIHSLEVNYRAENATSLSVQILPWDLVGSGFCRSPYTYHYLKLSP